MNGTQATAAVGATAVGGDAAFWLYDLAQWSAYALPQTPPPDMPLTVAIGVSGGLLWLIRYLAGWLPSSPGSAP